MATTQRVWYINDSRAVVTWSTAVVNGAATTRIRRAVETTRTVDGVTQKSDLSTFIWANPGDKVTTTQVAYAQNEASSDALPAVPTQPTTTPTVTAETGYDIFLLIGQSNMAGRGTDINVARYDYTDPRILQYATAGTYANQISLAVDPLGHMDATQATNPGVGPAMEFARLYTMTIPNRKVLLVPSAWGGTGFLTDSSQGGGTLRWKTTTTGTNGLYQRSVTSVKAALAAAPAGSRIVGALWLQGEQDSDPATDKTAYRTEFEKLITQLRIDLNIPNLPFIAGQMTYEFRYPAASQAILDSRAAIDAVHKGITNRIANTAFAPGPGPGFTDTTTGTTHYNAVGQRFNGRSFYAAYLRAKAGVTTTPADTATPVAPTAAPTLAANGSPTSTTIPVTVGSVTNAAAYDIEYKPTSASTWTVATTSAASGAYTLTGLTAATGYDIRARGRSAAGTGPYSTTLQVSTVAAGTGPTFTQRYSNGFTTTSTTGIPGFTDVTNDGIGRVDANGAYIQGTGTTVAQRLYTPPTQPTSNDQYVDVGIGAVGTSSSRSPYGYIRATITGTAISNGLYGFYDTSTGTARLYKFAAATTTELTPASGAAVAQPTKIRWAVVGNTISVYVNDSTTPLYSVTDSTVTSGNTYIGFRYTNTGDLAQRARSFANGDITA